MACKLKKQECEMYCQCMNDRSLCPNFISELNLLSQITDKVKELNLETTDTNEEVKEQPKQNNSNEIIINTKEEVKTGKEPGMAVNIREDGMPEGKKFTADNQPPPNTKKDGWMKKKFNRDMIRSMMEAKMNIIPEELKPDLIKFYGEGIVETLTIGQLITFKQVIKAAEKGDSVAATFIVEHGIGRPVQAVAQSDINGNDLPRIRIGLPNGMTIDFPSTTEGLDKKLKKNEEQ